MRRINMHQQKGLSTKSVAIAGSQAASSLTDAGDEPLRHPFWREMRRIWYVTFEVRGRGTRLRKRRVIETRTFATEAEAKQFARAKLDEGLAVNAGTINPHLPKQIIPPNRIASWLEDNDTDAHPRVSENQ